MTLLEKLKMEVENKQLKVPNTRMVFFALGEEGSAYLSEASLEDLVPFLEQWCAARRVEMGRVH